MARMGNNGIEAVTVREAVDRLRNTAPTQSASPPKKVRGEPGDDAWVVMDPGNLKFWCGSVKGFVKEFGLPQAKRFDAGHRAYAERARTRLSRRRFREFSRQGLITCTVLDAKRRLNGEVFEAEPFNLAHGTRLERPKSRKQGRTPLPPQPPFPMPSGSLADAQRRQQEALTALSEAERELREAEAKLQRALAEHVEAASQLQAQVNERYGSR
jgi:hypothetical protein